MYPETMSIVFTFRQSFDTSTRARACGSGNKDYKYCLCYDNDMNKVDDFGTVIIGALVFWLVFSLVEGFLRRIGYPFHVFAFALIASLAWFYLPRGEKQ